MRDAYLLWVQAFDQQQLRLPQLQQPQALSSNNFIKCHKLKKTKIPLKFHNQFQYSNVQTLASDSGKKIALADFTNREDPTPLSTKSNFSLTCFCNGENVPTDFDSTMPGEWFGLVGSKTTVSISGLATSNSYSNAIITCIVRYMD